MIAASSRNSPILGAVQVVLSRPESHDVSFTVASGAMFVNADRSGRSTINEEFDVMADASSRNLQADSVNM